eukprot:CAMPEP_0113892866 /NCGR_PEP_ID=MMETSP0780_2-20120614/15701_1 /TAXON_ID=652834 /ORGANISM="Palpitomonas bilix" /LENGTH=84 /DNA_ID=CAMNT_0000882945 /DNA_START=229 /DNA_END=480 /DNA_ORIENTATION=+ /assembly_acc=CAM_ASM_000599
MSSSDTDCSYAISRVCVYVREGSFQPKSDFAFNPAYIELAGHIVVKNRERFEVGGGEEVEGWLREVELKKEEGRGVFEQVEKEW